MIAPVKLPPPSPKAVLHKAVSPIMRTVVPSLPIRPFGFHPLAWALFLKSGVSCTRVGQVIGSAKASKGTHAQTGVYQGAPFGACFDMHVTDMTHAQVIHNIVQPLAALGFVPYMRVPGEDHWPASEAYHVHVVYPGCAMVTSVAHQVEDWLGAPLKNGLASHVPYHAYANTHDERLAAKTLFANHTVVTV